MKLKPLKKLTGLDYITSTIFGYVEEFLNQLKPNPFLKGNLIEVPVTTSSAWHNHGLGSVPQGWIVVDKSANVTVWRLDWDNKQIRLDASGTATLKIWVF